MIRLEKTTLIYLVLAGCCDTISGVMLMAAPVWTLSVMGVASTLVEPVYMQWIGAFVFSVGLSYFTPFLVRDRRAMVRGLLVTTLIVRVVIASFSGWSILRGALDPTWMSVPMSDAAMAAIQAVLLVMLAGKDKA
ncbi:MAG TPA: hypothetical protein PKC67_03065 [Kiritimatiellia bacterium]|nr:hypothetical protein [Kiritimatiellia bacterium]HMP33307.1 hypothetical protein [Kiritimatiellia bacterium]